MSLFDNISYFFFYSKVNRVKNINLLRGIHSFSSGMEGIRCDISFEKAVKRDFVSLIQFTCRQAMDFQTYYRIFDS